MSRPKHPRAGPGRAWRWPALTATLLLAATALLPAQQVVREGFGGRETLWVRGQADARYTLHRHELTDTFAHSAPTSEYFQLTAELGSQILFDYPTPRAPLGEELSASVWVRSSKRGIQLRARLVLPRETGPQVGEPLTTVLPGERCETVGRWTRLELPRPTKLAKQQQQVLRTQLGRDVDFTDAYIDRLMLNLYPGEPGALEVWVDDLEIGPVAVTRPPPGGDPGRKGGPMPAVPAVRRPDRPLVELNRDRLLIGGKPFFFRGIRYSGTPLPALAAAGFNTLWVDASTPAEQLDEAANAGFWLVPTLPDLNATPARLASRTTGTGDLTRAESDQLGQQVGHFRAGDAVLFWDLGGGRLAEQQELVAKTGQVVRGADPQRPVGADVWDGLWPYSRHIDLLGVHRWPLMSSLELTRYGDWLTQRRLLARPGTFVWTWVQTHLPDWYTDLVYQKSGTEGFNEPVGPQPEQVRLLTYVALAAGCRGIGFWSDRFLADSHTGRDRLLTLALLNQEMKMIEPLLLTLNEPPSWVEGCTSAPDPPLTPRALPQVKAAVLRSGKGILVVPMWLGDGAQMVPGQSAAAGLTVMVPLVPEGAMAWEVTPGEVRQLACERVVGGTKVTVPEFGLTTCIVFTHDNGPTGQIAEWQKHAQATAKQAAQWSYDLAAAELVKVTRVQAQLEQLAPRVPDADALLKDSRDRLEATRRYWDEQSYRLAYREAQRAVRPLRILMRAQWENAARTLDVPSASPYVASFYTLPRHWELWRNVRQMTVRPDALLGGDFERNPVPGERKLPLGQAQRTRKPDPPKPPEPPEPSPRPPAGPERSGVDRLASLDKTRPPAREKDRPVAPPWTVQQSSLDDMETFAHIVDGGASEGRECLELEVRPKQVEVAAGQKPPPPPVALERTFLAVHSPEVRLPPGTLVRISAWVKIPNGVGASADGALFYDSIGGEPLAVRLAGPVKEWRKFSLYRQVPASGSVSVTLALTGIGQAYFDDVRIEPLGPAAGR